MGKPTVSKSPSSPKTGKAAATRIAILQSAQRAFAKSGYDGAGVREIASGAGVSAMLVNRYFGSKERLFAEAVAETMKAPTLLRPENRVSPDFAKAMAQTLVGITDPSTDALAGFRILLKSAGSERAAKIGRRMIEAGHQKTMRESLRGGQASIRAGVLLSLIMGFQAMRQTLRLSDLAKASESDLLNVLYPVFRLLVHGEAGPASHGA